MAQRLTQPALGFAENGETHENTRASAYCPSEWAPQRCPHAAWCRGQAILNGHKLNFES